MKKIKPSALLMVFVLTTVAVLSPAAIAGTSTWVIMLGRIDSYGGTFALGFVWAEAEIGNWAKVFGGFIQGVTGPPFVITLPLSFYVFNLTSTTTAELNYSGYDFYVSGNWDVYNVTIFHGINITTVVDEGPGNLTVTDLIMGGSFTIDITGIDLIEGTILFEDPSDEPIPTGDITGEAGVPDYKVNIWDLVHVAKAYGTDVTSQSYWVSLNPLGANFFVDFDFNQQIDILDLTTVAANLGETY